MRAALIRHRDSAGDAVERIDAEARRDKGGALHLTYRVAGDLSRVLMPEPAIAARADELWRTTCLEAFVRTQTDDEYYEFNFSPSTRWAAYRFDRRRAGMAPASVAAPRLDVRRGQDQFELSAVVTLADAPDAPWRIGLAAIVEEQGGATSYWALAHPPGGPDFHHPDCFARELPLVVRF